MGVEPDWPPCDVIVGNPPFLGDKKMRAELGDDYVDALRKLYDGRIPGQSDLVCYWFEKARAMIADGKVKRAGLLATQGIRGGANREVLKRIKETGDIFWAQSDRDWIQNGVAVHVSMVGFDDGAEKSHILDDQSVGQINSDLTSSADFTQARRLSENKNLCFQGPVVVGPFDIEPEVAREMLRQVNPHHKPNSDVIFPLKNGADITGRSRGWYIIDFGSRSLEESSLYETPFEYVKKYVKPLRDKNRDKQRRSYWWRHGRSGADMKAALQDKSRYIGTPLVAKHRLFVWIDKGTLVNQLVNVFARDDDYFFGVLHSCVHELWARATGTQLREVESGFRYTPTTTFETFPFPWPPGQEPSRRGEAFANDLISAGSLDKARLPINSDSGANASPLQHERAIAQAAKELNTLRDNWLNPYKDQPSALDVTAKKRTLTNLYNDHPTWLQLAHRKLDDAVLDAYGWPHDLSDDEILARLLALNLERAR